MAKNRIDESFQKIVDESKDNLYLRLRDIDNETWFVFAGIIITFVLLSRIKELTTSDVFFITTAQILCYIVYYKRKIDSVTDKNELEIKYNLIYPLNSGLEPPKYLKKYPDFINFLFEIRDFYYLNIPAYYELVENIGNYTDIHNQLITRDMIYYSENLDIAIDYSRKSMNSLHSMIFKTYVDNNATKKFHDSLKTLKQIFTEKNAEIIELVNIRFNKKKLNVTSKYFYQDGPQAHNIFEDIWKKSQYEMY